LTLYCRENEIRGRKELGDEENENFSSVFIWR
jgi:hypothetical protein